MDKYVTTREQADAYLKANYRDWVLVTVATGKVVTDGLDFDAKPILDPSVAFYTRHDEPLVSTVGPHTQAIKGVTGVETIEAHEPVHTIFSQAEADEFLTVKAAEWVIVSKANFAVVSFGNGASELRDNQMRFVLSTPVDTQAVKGVTGAETVEARESVYGPFSVHAEAEQAMKAAMTSQPGWAKLNNVQKSAMEMIVHKMARVLNNSADYDDNWHDIAGYATLAENDAKSRKLTH